MIFNLALAALLSAAAASADGRLAHRSPAHGHSPLAGERRAVHTLQARDSSANGIGAETLGWWLSGSACQGSGADKCLEAVGEDFASSWEDAKAPDAAASSSSASNSAASSTSSSSVASSSSSSSSSAASSAHSSSSEATSHAASSSTSSHAEPSSASSHAEPSFSTHISLPSSSSHAEPQSSSSSSHAEPSSSHAEPSSSSHAEPTSTPHSSSSSTPSSSSSAPAATSSSSSGSCPASKRDQLPLSGTKLATNALRAHNDARAQAGVPALAWSAELAALAASRADRCQWARGDAAENLAAGYPNVASAVREWGADARSEQGAQLLGAAVGKVGCAVRMCDFKEQHPDVFDFGAVKFYVCAYDVAVSA